MHADIEIYLSGEGFPSFYPISASIDYGINTIPTASVGLDASHLQLLCNFEQYRRKEVTLYVKTVRGCLYFDGLVDGMSFSQAQGSLQARLILKSKYQWLMETYPRLPGLHPTSNDIFTINAPVATTIGNPDTYFRSIALGQMNFDTDVNVIDFLVKVCRNAVDLQRNVRQVAKIDTQAGLYKILNESEVSLKQRYPLLIQLLDNIDTSAVQGMTIHTSYVGVAPWILEAVSKMQNNLFDAFITMIDNFNCALVVGNNRAFVVPNTGFLKVPHQKIPSIGKQASVVNTCYPAEYDTFNFNDSGYIDIRGCYITANESAGSPVSEGKHKKDAIDYGEYIDPDTKTGMIYVTSLPQFISPMLDARTAIAGKAMHTQIAEGNDELQSVSTTGDLKKGLASTNAKFQELSIEIRRKLINSWAQTEYLKMKFKDRTGSINAVFNNNWAPGAVGTIYTRHPGTYVDFFVTGVSHSFSISQNTGQANTTVQFNCGRLGSSLNTGVDKIDLYNFDYKTARTFAEDFIKNIGN